jgi:hypothetical protein
MQNAPVEMQVEQVEKDKEEEKVEDRRGGVE